MIRSFLRWVIRMLVGFEPARPDAAREFVPWSSDEWSRAYARQRLALREPAAPFLERCTVCGHDFDYEGPGTPPRLVCGLCAQRHGLINNGKESR